MELHISCYVASVTIIPLGRNFSRSDIECPGDLISYNCSIQSNRETVHLTWRVTLPGQMPINITYGDASNKSVDHINSFITIVLTQYVRDVYVESVFQLKVQAGVFTNQTILECLIADLGSAMTYIFVNSSGINNIFGPTKVLS